ncbi:prorelaxin-like [Sorex araneus]|uniref:prorelaxin-like n=1 Tax=Sorex araneus TaxID=42254 RepID=UPI002433A049|nr:prorelaxin-like [Sorex araneus]
MQRLLSFHLLGILLLLSQLPRESQGQKLSWNTVIKACGRELARMQIRICGSSLSTWSDGIAPRIRREAGPLPDLEHISLFSNYYLDLALEKEKRERPRDINLSIEDVLLETKPTYNKTKEEQTLKMISEYIAKLLNRTLSLNNPITLKLQQLASENKEISFKEFQEIIATEGNHIPSKEISKEPGEQTRKKRQVAFELSNKCCHSGCTLRELARFC